MFPTGKETTSSRWDDYSNLWQVLDDKTFRYQ